jgi:hypothetical protein
MAGLIRATAPGRPAAIRGLRPIPGQRRFSGRLQALDGEYLGLGGEALAPPARPRRFWPAPALVCSRCCSSRIVAHATR